MAGRPEKHTVDFFPHDANAGKKKTLTIMFNHFGHEGISAWWLLLEEISSTENHIVCIRNTEDFEYLAAKLHFQPDKLKQILDKMSSLEAIDSDWYQKGYIWSQNFVERLKPVYDMRKQALPDIKTIVNTDNAISMPDNAISMPDNTQTKGTKGTKLNKTKVKRESSPEDFENYKDSLRVEFSDLDFDMELRKFSTYWSEGNKKLQRPKTALLNWMTKAREFKQKNGGNNGAYQRDFKGLPGNRPAGAFDGFEEADSEA